MRGGVWERGGAINRDVVKEREAVLGARRGVWERDAARHVATNATHPSRRSPSKKRVGAVQIMGFRGIAMAISARFGVVIAIV